MPASTTHGFSLIAKNQWELPATGKMHVPVRAIASPSLLQRMDAKSIEQARNVAELPGIMRASYMMPDAHQGYGFCIGGVAGFDAKEGIISPGAIGFDINCGMRLIATNLTHADIKPHIKKLIDDIFIRVPSGVACKSKMPLKKNQIDEVLSHGAKWAIDEGMGWKEDLAFMEENGKMPHADPAAVSARAKGRGQNQIGTLGSGNHYLEIQTTTADQIFDAPTAKAFGVEKPKQVFIMVHCGSRGMGHQVATDYLEQFLEYDRANGIALKDKELAHAPFESEEGQAYFSAMQASANFAFANRQVITHSIRESFARILKENAEELGMRIVYDVTHNVAKREKNKIQGKTRTVIVHRKGATRAFGPGNEELPRAYRKTGQPVIVGGSMQTGSFVCAGTKTAEEQTFASTMHGAGRTISRHAAKQHHSFETIAKEMEAQGIYLRTASKQGIAEEAGAAYKDIFEVVQAAHDAGISKKVFALRPIGNIKG
ncbi:MAG: RtcB family protein [Candidatus Iainarchaeum archaeon]|uniref:tRNA-splicing ligase RtcB n=1 Tax=Candidatus Iainarchaeum sp. TaxID=3101447 RepID=A0A7T9DKE7_9ARCH|nr:MAG: RtcB family protein [Candidatus Diapherotrites archaeon]